MNTSTGRFLARALLALTATCGSVFTSSEALAAAQVVGPAATVSPCTNFTFNVAITACAGGYQGNLLQSSVTDSAALAALVALGAPGSGNYIDPKLQNLNANTGEINFATSLTGMTVFGIHVGAAGDKNGQGTFFFQFDGGAAGIDKILISSRAGANNSGLSNAALFKTGVAAVPEPGTWAMMLVGFGAIGVSMRRRRAISAIPQLA